MSGWETENALWRLKQVYTNNNNTNMPIKVFTILGGKCPHRGCEFDSQTCRTCQYFYRTGTGTFFWCNHPVETEAAPTPKKSPEIAKPKRKRGRPPGKAAKKPVKRTKIKK